LQNDENPGYVKFLRDGKATCFGDGGLMAAWAKHRADDDTPPAEAAGGDDE
jgi:hypothetical protein